MDSEKQISVEDINEAGKACYEMIKNFPFKTAVSFEPILEYWEEKSKSGDKNLAAYAKNVLEEVDAVPGLKKPVKNDKILKKNQEIIKKIMSPVFPEALKENEIKAASKPFEFNRFLATRRFEDLIKRDDNYQAVLDNLDEIGFAFLRFAHACSFIMNEFHGVNLHVASPFLFKIKDHETGLDAYYKMTINKDFVRIKVNGKVEPLSRDIIKELLNNFQDIGLWLKYLPPEKYRFEGFALLSLVNVTVHEVVSSMKNDLIEREAITTARRYKSIQNSIRSLLRNPTLKIGLGVYNENKTSVRNFGHKVWSNLNCKNSIENINLAFEGSIYQEVAQRGMPVIIEDLEGIAEPTMLEKSLVDKSIKSMIVTPLFHDQEIIGFLEVASPSINELNILSTVNLKEVIPLFSIALKRSLDEMDNQIEAIIKEKCTAIHPSVEWKFTQGAIKLLDRQRNGEPAEMDPIVFKEVYPLYGLADIRNSSEERNRAIQADILENLQRAKEVIKKAKKVTSFPILDEFNYRIGKLSTKIKSRVNSSDETRIFTFLREEVDPLFGFLKKDFAELKVPIKNYYSKIDPKIGLVYHRRKLYEESVTRINEAISSFLDREEEKGQEMYPHYFERYYTDGVDYNIYVGQSILQNRQFDLVCLYNLRLWQLKMMCDLTREVAILKKELPVPMDTAQLILVHNDSLSIRFRMDEKQFDVDGAYNVRYEILKKRIDKAGVKDTDERLTQPGKIAIVFSHDENAEEYKKYIAFLQKQGYLEKEIEELVLEDLQGVQGLKAIRVTVSDRDTKEVDITEIMEAIKN